MTVIIFLIVLAVLVFVHELGHFLAAKASGIRVDEFGIGFPPKIFSVTKGETRYSLNAIPFGGFVKIHGEDPNEESMSGPDSSRSFVNKPKWIQAIVLVAGITFNIIFAWLLLSVGFMMGMPAPQGYSETAPVQNTVLTVTSVSPNSSAEQAGLKGGDKLLALESGQDKITEMTPQQMQDFVAAHKDQPVLFTYQRGEETGTVTVTPTVGLVPDRATIGVTLDAVGILKLPFFQSFIEGVKLTWYLIEATVIGLGMFLYQAVTGGANFSDVAGPVGIAGLVGDATDLGIVYLLSFVAFISINLAVMNLIPFPALDGGRLLFVIIEKIKGSPIKPVIANTINTVGFAFLLLLMLVVTFSDIIKLIR